MALTNFAALTNEELTVWSRDTWYAARNMQFLNQFTGTGPESMIQRITELTKSQKGARAVLTLVKDLEGDGVAGDRTLEGNEEELKSDDIVIRIDQLRHANRSQGKMADQKSVVNFRKNSRYTLAYWLSDRMDQMAFLALSGVAFTNKTNGATRTGSDLPLLDFAADVTAPTANRYFRWDATNGLLDGTDGAFATSNITAADTLSWASLIELKAVAQERFVKPIRMNNGVEYYNIFVTPTCMSKLKQDPDFLANIRNTAPRTMDGVLFKGAETYYVDGMAIHSYRHVWNTRGLASGVGKWGAGSDIDGCKVLLCGAQALGFADIGTAEWVEKYFDYDNQPGISYGKIMGMKKPVFDSLESGTTEDFGVMVLNVAQ